MARNSKAFGNSMWVEAWRSFSHNKTGLLGLAMVIILIVMAVFANQIAPAGFDDQNLIMRFKPPSLEHLFGTDNLGRDIFSRVVIGSRYSLAIGIAAATFSCVLGVFFGAFRRHPGLYTLPYPLGRRHTWGSWQNLPDSCRCRPISEHITGPPVSPPVLSCGRRIAMRWPYRAPTPCSDCRSSSNPWSR